MNVPSFLIGLLALASVSAATPAPPATLLARVDAPGPIASFPLPAFARLQDASGQPYALVQATADQLNQSGWTFQILDSGADSATYILAHEFRKGARLSAQGQFHILHDDGRRLVIRSSSLRLDIQRLGDLGFQCRPLPSAPLPRAPLAFSLAATPRFSPVVSNAWISEMIAQIQQTNLFASVAELSGPLPAVAGGSLAPIPSRNQDSPAPLRRATDLAYERFLALGLLPSFQSWSAEDFSNRNVIATLPGATASSEIVVVCAHIDDMPSGSLAPGADDNASGSAAVLAAAEALRRFSFERSLRFVLFTGEEQGLYGSAAHAAACAAAGDPLVAVLNLDMIAWDGNGDDALNLYVRPGNTSEWAAASTLTNVVATYGLSDSLAPTIISEEVGWSDHYSFNSFGYPAICIIEEDVADFNPHYHTTNDTLDRLDLPFFTRAAQAVAATAAHLATPTQRLLFDSIQIQNGAFQSPSDDIGVGSFLARHLSGALEGLDPHDAAWASMPTNPHPAWLQIYTDPDSSPLAIDSRPPDGESIFRGKLAAVKSSPGPLSCPNRLHFAFAGGPDPSCAYVVHVSVDSNATPSGAAFDCVTNLSPLVANGGFLDLPGLTNVPDGAVYGTCEISRRLVSHASSNLPLRLSFLSSNAVSLSIPCQPGVRVLDSAESASRLAPDPLWLPLASFTNDPPPDASSFESGWTPVEHSLDPSAAGDSSSRYFRIRRQWLSP